MPHAQDGYQNLGKGGSTADFTTSIFLRTATSPIGPKKKKINTLNVQVQRGLIGFCLQREKSNPSAFKYDNREGGKKEAH